MPTTGECFRSHQPGHWANNCPLKTTTKPTATADASVSPPVIHCPCNGRACNVFTSKTKKNPNRRFYTCSSIPSCGFFKWCDEVSIIKSESISVHPTCHDVHIQPESKQVGNDGSAFPTLIGYSGLDSVDDESLLHETELDSDGNVKRSRLGVVVESELNPTSSSESTTLGNRVVDGIVESVTDYVKDTLPMNAVTVRKESIPVFAGFNNRKPVSNGVFVSADGRNQVYEDWVGLETEEQVLPSLAPKHFDERQVETLCSDLLKLNGKASYASEDITGVSQNTSDSVSNSKTKPDHKHQPEHQSTTSGETGASFSGSSYLLNLIEQYNLEKLHFESVSVKYVDALTAFTGSYKQLESLRDRAHSLRKQLSEVEKQVKLYEAKTSECAMSLQEVSGVMAKLQKQMVETAGNVAKEVRVNKQRNFAAP